MFSSEVVQVKPEVQKVYDTNKKLIRQFLLTIIDDDSYFKGFNPYATQSKLEVALIEFFKDIVVPNKRCLIGMMKLRLPNYFVAARLDGRRPILDKWYPEEIQVEQIPIIVEEIKPKLIIQQAVLVQVVEKENIPQVSREVLKVDVFDSITCSQSVRKEFKSELHPFTLDCLLLGGSKRTYQKRKKDIVRDSFKILKMKNVISEKGGTNSRIDVTRENGYTCYVSFDFRGEHIEIESSGINPKQVKAEEDCFKQLNSFFRDYNYKEESESEVSYGSDEMRKIPVEQLGDQELLSEVSGVDDREMFKVTVESQEKSVRSLDGFEQLGRSFFSYEEVGEPITIRIQLKTDVSTFNVEADSYLDAFDLLKLNIIDFLKNSMDYGLQLSSYCASKNYPPPFLRYYEIETLKPPLVGELCVGNFCVVSKFGTTKEEILRELSERAMKWLSVNDINPGFLTDPEGIQFTDDDFEEYGDDTVYDERDVLNEV